MKRPARLLALMLGLAGCASPIAQAPAERQVTARQISLPAQLPPMKAFSSTPVQPVTQTNARIATDFLDLTFALESGRSLPVLTRFDGPITLRVTGGTSAALDHDLSLLLGRLRTEAGIAISRVPASQPASITIEMISQRDLQRLVPSAACFVAPNVSSWSDYKSARRSPRTDWTLMTTRKTMAIFIPSDVSPQEMRDCLHEEVAQALGPVNDLYRLTDSVFNDDNFHTVLTGFDMLILRAYYDPALHSGMSRDEVAAALPAILARLNPAGGYGTPGYIAPTPVAWKQAIATALGGSPNGARRAAAHKAVMIARSQGWYDTRLAFALYAQGRLNLGVNRDIALASFREAGRIYAAQPETSLQAAHMGVQLAAYALSSGNTDTAIAIADQHIPAVQQAQNAVLLATLLAIKAEALELQGRVAEAQLVRLDSLGWARYGFGSDDAVSERMSEIAAIVPATKS